MVVNESNSLNELLVFIVLKCIETSLFIMGSTVFNEPNL